MLRVCEIKPSPTLEERYWAKVDVRGSDECWPWLASTTGPMNHGSIYYGNWPDGRHYNIKAHRLAWMLDTGDLPPDDLKVCHRCDNPSCQNPMHLELGTQGDNIRDMFKRGRGRPKTAPPGEKHHMAKLTETQVREIIRLRKEGVMVKDIGEIFGVRHSQISRITTGKRWTHIGMTT